MGAQGVVLMMELRNEKNPSAVEGKMLNGVGLGANQTGRKRSRAGRPLHTYVALLNPASYKIASELHTCYSVKAGGPCIRALDSKVAVLGVNCVII